MLKDDWSRDRIMEEVSAAGVSCYSGSCSEIYLEKAFDLFRKMDSATTRRMTDEVDSRFRGNDGEGRDDSEIASAFAKATADRSSG
jgi:hypothetical protein